ncbi:hypothetical protein [Niastella vici]|uniref:hypothetical protein n=1 Tax=Niastella vici TaxID=1703345 RepID=UPI00118147A5|nr:hypothetical protein [Niastella vici]
MDGILFSSFCQDPSILIGLVQSIIGGIETGVSLINDWCEYFKHPLRCCFSMKIIFVLYNRTCEMSGKKAGAGIFLLYFCFNDF